MNSEIRDQESKRVLELVAETKRRLQDRAIELRRLSGVDSAEAAFEASSYENGPVLEGYLEIKFSQDDALCWCIDVHWDHDSWTVEGTLDRSLCGQQKTLREVPAESARSLPDFERLLKRSLRELLSLNIPESSSDSRSGWPARAEAKQ